MTARDARFHSVWRGQTYSTSPLNVVDMNVSNMDFTFRIDQASDELVVSGGKSTGVTFEGVAREFTVADGFWRLKSFDNGNSFTDSLRTPAMRIDKFTNGSGVSWYRDVFCYMSIQGRRISTKY